MTSQEVRQKFLEFFEKRGHAVIPSASLVPENDPSVLFNTAGMQPLVPYLLGQKHPQGTRLVDIQKCVRTTDIDEIGDNTHLTFFEMMGNWSLGDYWKSESINWSYELLTSKTEGFGLDPQRLFVTCFEGNADAPKDEESAEIWKEIFAKNNVTGERIYFLPKEKNWWSAGENGPCGPDTEMFYDLTGELNSGMTLEQYKEADDNQKVVEIWNNVFMEYIAKDGKVIDKLQNRNVDTGAGFERMMSVIQNKKNVFETDLFEPLIGKLTNSNLPDKEKRIIVDHIRTSVFLLNDGVKPSNKDRGYILRRLLRRAWALEYKYTLSPQVLEEIIIGTIDMYKSTYPELEKNKETIINSYFAEWQQFKNTFEKGLREFEKFHRGPANLSDLDSLPMVIPGVIAYELFTTFGFPIELIIEIARDKNLKVDIEGFQQKMKEHQEISRAGAEKKFAGGLADHSEKSIQYHTATHLLHTALRKVLGEHVIQRGSNITPERLRFDFSHGEKMTPEQIKAVEDLVNQQIEKDLPVTKQEMPKDEAEKLGALHAFGEKYGDLVTVYTVGNEGEVFSREFCGGPHVSTTGDLARGTDPESSRDRKFKITKEESVAQGIRRIKAVLE